MSFPSDDLPTSDVKVVPSISQSFPGRVLPAGISGSPAIFADRKSFTSGSIPGASLLNLGSTIPGGISR